MPDKIAMRLGSLILAGGRSTRMGRPKESLPFGGDTLLGRAIAAVATACHPILVVARSDQHLPPLPPTADRVADASPGDGPLAAIATGLAHLRRAHGFADDDAAFVVGCDQPFVDAALIALLHGRLGDARLVLPRAAGHLQPLCAIWRIGTDITIGELLRADVRTPRRVAEVVPTRVVDEAELRAFDPDLRCLHNVNSPTDYERALADRRP